LKSCFCSGLHPCLDSRRRLGLTFSLYCVYGWHSGIPLCLKCTAICRTCQRIPFIGVQKANLLNPASIRGFGIRRVRPCQSLGAADFVLDICMAFNALLDLFTKRTTEEVDGDDVLETLPETCDPCRLASGRRISKLLKQLAIVDATGIGKRCFICLKDNCRRDCTSRTEASPPSCGSLSPPFESFAVLLGVGKKVAGVPSAMLHTAAASAKPSPGGWLPF